MEMDGRQRTIVAWYGAMPEGLARLVAECQKLVAGLLPGFVPYALEQVHATVVGLERVADTAEENRNFSVLRGERRRMDAEGYLRYLGESSLLPFEVQFGGFEDRDYPFTSRGLRLYERSFSVQGDKVVLMGWPVGGKALDEMRREAQRFGILHAYHRVAGDVDNDCYLRLGQCAGKAMDENAVRAFLRARGPVMAEMSVDALRVVCYEDERLPVASSAASAI